MGHRLSKIYTRTGDDGTTGLGDGSRVPKNSLRIEAMGCVDELNALLGLLLTENLPESISQHLIEIQHDLFNLGGELSIPGYTLLDASRTNALEELLDQLNAALPPLREFILPGGTRAASVCHLARTVCRRAERILITTAREHEIQPSGIAYLNRLSDLLFVMARHLNQVAGVQDVLWRHEKSSATP